MEEDDIPTLDEQDGVDPGVALADEGDPASQDYIDPGIPYGVPDQATGVDPLFAHPATRMPPTPVPNLILSGPQGSPSPAPIAAPQGPPPDPDFANRELMRRLYYNLKDTPIAEAEGAVGAALRFQGLRQYQNDIANGVNPAEALAKSAPLMFAGPRQATLGQAGTFIKNTTQSPFVHYKGSIWSRNRDGTFTKVMEGAPEQPKVSTLDAQTHASLLNEARTIRKVLDSGLDENKAPLTTSAKIKLVDQIAAKNRQALAIEGKYNKPAAASAVPSAKISAPPQSGRIRVINPQGKTGTWPAGKPLPAGFRLAQ